MKRIIIISLLVTAVSIMGFRLTSIYFEQNTLFKRIEIEPSEQAAFPVMQLITNLKAERWNLLHQSFSDSTSCNELLALFEISLEDHDVGFFANNLIQFNLTEVTPTSKSPNAAHWINVNVKIGKTKEEEPVLKFLSTFDPIGNQYFIREFELSGQIIVENDGKNGRIEIPDITENSCSINSTEDGFSYIRLKHRQNSSSEVFNEIVMGDNPNLTNEIIPANYFSTNCIVQVPFAEREIDDVKFAPGNVISAEDAREFEIGDIFRNIIDGYGTLTIPDPNGNTVSYPTGFFLDNLLNRFFILSNKTNKISSYGGGQGQFKFDKPKALTMIGDFIYVLDRGEANNIKVIKPVFLLGALRLISVAESNFDTDLKGASDITGFAGETENVLYISNTFSETITRVIIDPETGLIKESNLSSVIIHQEYFDENGNAKPIGVISRLECSPRNSNSNNILMAIQGNKQTLALNTNGLDPESELQLNFKHEFPSGTGLVNIGYNLGDKSFFVSDNYKGKIHVFSAFGDYLGSGGKFGQSQTGQEFFYPNIVSSNNFSNEAIEMIVGSEWGIKTGFKRIFPQADLGELQVIEKAPLATSNSNEGIISFRFALTSGYLVKEIKLKLNNQLIKTSNSGFFPNIYAENFLTNLSGENGLSDKLNFGWNTFEVELTGELSGPSNANLEYKRTKKMEFYFVPSVIDQKLSLGDADSATVQHDKTNNPFYVYKNTLITGEGDFYLYNGKIILMEGVDLTITDDKLFIVSNEDFEFRCGAKLNIVTKKDIPKVFKDSYFNGLLENYNMISTTGEYTGGVGSGSAPSSMLEFISCRFDNYLGKAVHVQQGRATFANCEFESTYKTKLPINFLASAAIFVDPLARIDIRGGSYLNNDIAIDGNASDLYIGHPAREYKDVVIEDPVFENNIIAVHSFGSNVVVKNSTFHNNEAAVLDLNGELDISKNGRCTFENNKIGIIFSNVFDAESGHNLFINNNIDISFIIPEIPDSVITGFDITCNYWKHDEVEGSPIIELYSDPTLEETPELDITFNYVPYLEKKGGNDTYTCTGEKSNGRYESSSSEVISFNKFDFHDQHQTFYSEMNKGQGVFHLLDDSLFSDQSSTNFGTYEKKRNLVDSYKESISRNTILTFLLSEHQRLLNHSKANDDDMKNYNYVFDLVKNNMLSKRTGVLGIIDDRLKFLELFNNNQRAADPPTTIRELSSDIITIYPNPARGIVNTRLNLHSEGVYSLTISDSNGIEIRKLLSNKFLLEGYHQLESQLEGVPPGLYIVSLHHNSEIIEARRLIVN